MSEEKKVTAKEVIAKIETAESVEEVEVLAEEGSEFKTVTDAAEKRVAELTEPDAEGEKAEGKSEKEEADAEGEKAEVKSEKEEEPAKRVKVNAKQYKAVAEKVKTYLEARTNRKELKEAAAVLRKKATGKTVEVKADDWKNLLAKLEDEVNYDQRRRGLAQPSKISKTLIAAFEEVNPDEK